MIDEEKWQRFWEEQAELYRARDVIASPDGKIGTKQSHVGSPRRPDEIGTPRDDVKKYILVEFPYPSGSGLHIGHTFAFTGGDVYARLKRMQGYNVLFPMGWDAFGLPTENYAIKTKRKPQEVTAENTKKFKEQMKKLAFSFDWSREVDTTDPAYYKWTQWIFIQLFKKGLAYKKEMPINWCPSCKIGLANEEVLQSRTGVSVCERCGAEVSRRSISQWVVKITDYADRLLEGLEKTDFVEKVKMAQVNWIGKSEGAKIRFQIQNPQSAVADSSLQKGAFKTPLIEGEMAGGQKGLDYLEVFTTRPDTIFGATFMVVAPEHELVQTIIRNPQSAAADSSLQKGAFKTPLIEGEKHEVQKGFDLEAIKNYVANARKKSDLERVELNKEKTGVFSGWYAINPATGKEIPIWISDFVLESYGTGAIMAVPAHDERDFEFAKKFGLPIIKVIKPNVIAKEGMTEAISGGLPRFARNDGEKAYTEIDNGILVNSGFLNGMEAKEAMKRMVEWLEEKGVGERANSFHLRDWIFSRQHYWGEPIPMIFCEKCGWQPVEEKDLPVKLPEVEHYEPTDTGESPLAKMTEWVKTKCPKCGGEAKRETDTMPNWAGSDWYFLRYIDPKNDKCLADMEKMKYWMPVDVYVGGDEHNTLHLLYSRFIVNFLYNIGVVPMAEPYYRRMSHGVILGPDGQRMSKSRGNVIVPDEMAEKWGVDVVRMYLMFMGPFEATMAWNERTLNGVKRFLDKFVKFIMNVIARNEMTKQSRGGLPRPANAGLAMTRLSASNDEAKVIINKLVDGVTKDMEGFGYNTAIAKLMKALHELENVIAIRQPAEKQSQMGSPRPADAGLAMTLDDKEIKTLIKLIAPLAPYTAEELWQKLGNAGNADLRSVHIAEWPKVGKKYLAEEMIVIPVAVNGKVRDQIKIYAGNGRDRSVPEQSEILEMAKGLEKIRRWIEGKKIVREIYVPGKMINLVVK